MAWTLPTALFFAAIATLLIGLTLYELKVPTVARRGFLPLTTTRGDRVFIGLLSAAFIHIAWLALVPAPIVVGSALAVFWFAVVLRWG